MTKSFVLSGLHEAWITPNIVACTKVHRPPFPVWAVIVGHISNVLMAVNSSVNCIIYGLISPQFRKAMAKKTRKWGLCKKSFGNNELRRAPSMGLPLRGGEGGPDVKKPKKCCPDIILKPTSTRLTPTTISGTTVVCNWFHQNLCSCDIKWDVF